MATITLADVPFNKTFTVSDEFLQEFNNSDAPGVKFESELVTLVEQVLESLTSEECLAVKSELMEFNEMNETMGFPKTSLQTAMLARVLCSISDYLETV